MKKIARLLMIFSFLIFFLSNSFSQDWKDIPVPADPGAGNIWELQEHMSDDFSYNKKGEQFYSKWRSSFINSWHNPSWKTDHSDVVDSHLVIRASKSNGTDINCGIVSSLAPLIYPVYLEARIKPNKLELSSNFWLLSTDSKREIDLMITFGGNAYPWMSKRNTSSFHVFLRDAYNNEAGNFFDRHMTVLPDSSIWSDDFHTFGLFWKSPTELTFYIDGVMVNDWSWQQANLYDNRINRKYIDKNKYNMDKELYLLFNTIEQQWRAERGHKTPDADFADETKNKMLVDWVRVYKPSPGNNTIKGKGVKINPTSINLKQGESFDLTKTYSVSKSVKKNMTWKSNNPKIAMVDANGIVKANLPGTAMLTFEVNGGQYKAIYYVTVKDLKNNKTEIEAEAYNTTGGSFNDGYVPYGAGATYVGLNMVNSGDWIDYIFPVEVPGDYKIEYRISSPLDNTQIEFIIDKDTISTDAVPNTGDWENYTTLSAAKTITNLTAGEHEVRIRATGPNKWQWNLDKFSLILVGEDQTADIPIAGINISRDYLVLTKGDLYKLKANVLPSNIGNNEVIWSSNNPEIAQISNEGVIKALKEGNTNIKATTLDKKYSVSCNITINEK